MSYPEQPHPHAYSAYPYGVAIPSGPSSSSNHAAQQRPRTPPPEPEPREKRTASWGSYNQFVGVGLTDPGPQSPQSNPYEAAPSPSRSPAQYQYPAPASARSSPYAHYQPTRQMSREADIADGIRPPADAPSRGGSESPSPSHMSWKGKGGNKIRRVQRRIVYDSEGKPRREKKDKYGVKDIPEGWTKEDEEAEREFLQSSMFNWQELMTWRFWIRKEWWYWYVILVVIGVLVLLMTIYHDDIVKWLTPAANWMKNLPAGWVIPIAVMFIISFPPLFGHEIVAILCGVVWGLWVGFGIVAAGTMLGEWGNFYAFKYVCRSRAEKYEKKNINYACLAHVIRHGGFMIIVAARLSAIPGHLTTAIFATCGQNIWIFSLAAFVTLPKQLVVVYLGVLFNAEAKSNTSKVISYTVLAIGAVITVGSAWYIYREMNKARIVIWRRHRVTLATKGVQLNELVYDANDVEVGGGGLRNDDRAAGAEPDSPMLQDFAAPAAGYAPYATQGYNDEREEVLGHGGGIGRGPSSGGHGGTRESYATPYDIAYDHDGEMSIYRVEGALEDRAAVERRVSQQLLERRSSAGHNTHEHAHAPRIRVDGPPPSAFPQPQPGGGGLQRAPSDASTYSTDPPTAYPSSFPVAQAHHAHSQSQPAHAFAHPGGHAHSQSHAHAQPASHPGGYV